MRDYNCDSCGVPDKICDFHHDCIADVWHAALKSVERRKTVRPKQTVQHLRAEIAMCAKKLSFYNNDFASPYIRSVYNKLWQLSAD